MNGSEGRPSQLGRDRPHMHAPNGNKTGRAAAQSPRAEAPPDLGTTTHTQELPYEIPRGRVAEISHAIACCEQGSGALIWIGEPGMGKSALLAHTAAETEARGSLVIRVPVRAISGQNGFEDSALDYVVRRLVDETEGIDASATIKSHSRKDDNESAHNQSATVLGRSLADLIAAGKHKRPVVFVIDDLEKLDETARGALIGAVIERRAPAVLLITAADSDLVRSLPYEVERRPLAPITNTDALFMLQESLETTVAPHVIQTLNQHVSGAPTALVETAQALSSAQLAGLSQLPDPLPVSATTHRAVSRDLIGIPARDREILLTAAVAVSDRTDLFLSAIDMSINELLNSRAARHLRLVAGHISIADPRIRAVVHGDASVGERTAVHQRLAKVHSKAGSEITALWHHALAALTGDAGLSERLLEVAERMLQLGDAAWAQRVAREGLSHATGGLRPRAMLVTGRAALHAGHVSDALGLLREAYRILPDHQRSEVAAALTAAVTYATGHVPEEIVRRDRQDLHTQELAVTFHAERRDFEAANEIIASLAENNPDFDPARLKLLRAWNETLAGRADAGLLLEAQSESTFLATVATRIVRALSLVRTGSINEARRLISSTISELGPSTSSSWEPERHNGSVHSAALTPLLSAYLHLIDVVVDYAQGNISSAQKTLQRAAFSLPMTLPYAGIVCVIAGRLSVLHDGKVDELATMLEKLVPTPPAPAIRSELFANRALAHLVAGETREAETLMEMTRGTDFRSVPLISRPNFHDISELLSLPPAAAHKMVVPDTDVSEIIEVQTDDVDALDMALRHLITGRRSAATSSPTQANEHLRRAAMLFEEIGAFAIARLALNWSEQIARGGNAGDQVNPAEVQVAKPGSPAQEPSHGAQLPRIANKSGLPAWAAALTEREREVAQIIASGATNREAASKLFVSVRTIEVHLTSIFRKLEIGSRVELAVVVSHAPMG